MIAESIWFHVEHILIVFFSEICFRLFCENEIRIKKKVDILPAHNFDDRVLSAVLSISISLFTFLL